MPGENDAPLTEEEKLAQSIQGDMNAGVEEKIAEALEKGIKLDQNGEPEEGQEGYQPQTATGTTPPPVVEQEETEQVLDEAAQEEARRIAAEEEAKLEDDDLSEGDGTVEGAQGTKVPKRVRVEGLPPAERFKTQAAIAHASAKGISVPQAMKQLYPEDFEEPQQRQQEQQVVEDPELVQARADLAAMETDLDGDAENHGLFTPELRKKLDTKAALERKIDRLEQKAEGAKAQREQAQIHERRTAYQQGWNASEDTVREMFPGHLEDDNSPLNKAVTEELLAINKAGRAHRDYGRPDLPEILFTKHAARLRIAAVAKGTPTKKADEPATRVLPAPGGQGARPGTPPNSDQRAAQRERTRAEASKVHDFETLARMMEEDLTGKPYEEASDLKFAL